LSVIVTAAVREPMAVGVKVTETEQLLLAGRELPQVLARAKSPALAPDKTMELKLIAPALVLTILKPCWALVELRFWAAKVNALWLVVRVTAWPVPERVTDWGEAVAVSVIVTAAARAPRDLGVKVTEMEHVAPMPREAPHVLLEMTKDVVFAPVRAIEEMAMAVVPVLFTEKVSGALVVLMF